MSGFALAWSRPRRSLAFAPLGLVPSQPGNVFGCLDRTGGLALAGSWRADNAAGLIAALRLRPDTPPSEILAAGWRKWATGLADRLRGPFAIAILDVASNSLYLARDFMGVEPLFYTRTAGGLAISSWPRVARSLGDGSDRINLAEVASFLGGAATDKTSTFFENVHRLAPGHWMTVSSSGETHIEPYWTVDLVEMRPAEASAGERFRDLLDQAVSRGLQEGEPIALLLSGGLDSSSIAGSLLHTLADPSNVQSLSMTYHDNKGWVDKQYIEALREHFPIVHHSLPSDKHDPLSSMDDYVGLFDGPTYGYGLSVSNRLLPMAAQLGCTALFHGHGGDEVVSYGMGRLNELARQGRWRDLWIEAEGAAFLWSMPRWQAFDRYLFHRPERRWLDRQWKRLGFAGAGLAAAESEVRSDELLAQCSQTPRPRSPHANPGHTERDLQIAAISAPLQPHALETLVVSGRHHGLDIRLPFLDRDLLEYSVSLPSDWKLRNGYTRYVVRRAMEGRVPDLVTWRRDKNDFTNDFQIGLIERSPRLRELVTPSNSDLKGLVSPQWFEQIWSKVEHGGSSIATNDARALWRVALLALWLEGDRQAGLPPHLRPIGVESNV